jgi:hypothetical protein
MSYSNKVYKINIKVGKSQCLRMFNSETAWQMSMKFGIGGLH